MSRPGRVPFVGIPSAKPGSEGRTDQALRSITGRMTTLRLNDNKTLEWAMSYQGAGGYDEGVLRIELGEGVWRFGAGGITISRSNVHIVAVAPGSALFRRNVAPDAPMITVTGSNVRFYGVSFQDMIGTESCIYATGDELTVDGCDFLACYQAALVDGCNLAIINSVRLREDVRITDRSIEFSGAVRLARVSGVVGHKVGVSMIYAGDSVSDSVFFGNNCTGSYAVDYKATGTTNAEAANSPAVNAR